MKPLRILIADDHPLNVKLLRAQLEAEGHHVLAAANGVEALALLEREEVDVILSDILMPKMDGYRLCYEVRNSERHRHLPFIIYTATYLSPSDEKLSLDLGADRYLRKPAAIEDILSAIREACASPRRQPTAALGPEDVLGHYNERLVAKLEQKNVELTAAVEQLALQGTALETAGDAILITDAGGLILRVNPAFTVMTGYTAAEAIGRTPRILKSGLQDEVFYRHFWDTISSGKTWRGEFANRRKDGTLYYADHTITPVRDAGSVITHYVGVMRDVTERKRAEEQLRDAHVQMRELLEHSPAVLYALKIDGQTIIPRLASENVTRLLGFEVAETLSYDWWYGRLHPDDRERAEAGIVETIAHGVSRTEYRLRHRDGRYVWVDDNRRLVRDAEGKPAELVGVWTDITERRRAQEELHESERRFRQMLDNLQLISMMLDREARITYCNDYLLRLTGWERAEILGASWFDVFIPPEDAAELRDAFTSLLADLPEFWHHTNEILTRSGERLLVQWNNSVLRAASGEVIGTASIGEDITSRTVAERELRRSEEHLRIIIGASNDAIWEWDLATGSVTLSDRAWSMLGLPRETFQLTIDAFNALVHPDDLPAFRQALVGHLKRGEPLQVRLRLRHNSGVWVPILARGQLQRETQTMIGAFTDLSVVERAEEQIGQQAALIDQARDAIVVRDLDNRITFWNRGAERLYGWSSASAVGRLFDEILRIDAGTFASAVASTLESGAWSGEVAAITAAGKEVIADSSWTLLCDDDGQPKSIFSIDTDTTDRKSLEKQFLRVQRLESLGTLAGGIAHDLNNVLMPILMGVTLLRRLESDPRCVKAIDNIELSVTRGTDLVKQVLLFARGSEGARAPVDLVKVLTDIHAMVESTFPKTITLTITVPSALAKVLGDATQLNQVLLNLCVNARDAMPAGGRITISAANTEIDHQYAIMHGGATVGTYVVIEVADTGTGMPKEVLNRIFEPFFTTKDLTRGTGLGLSTVQGIVRSHGGFMSVSSEVGRGSAFRVFLPAYSDGASGVVVEAEPEELPRGNGELILMVDDELSILSITKQTLETFGYGVLTASDSAEAIAIYSRNRSSIAAVVTDMMMPVIDGAAMIAVLRRIDPEVPVIAMSGDTETTQMTRATNAGATHFLAKPCSAADLLRALAHVLRSGAV